MRVAQSGMGTTPLDGRSIADGSGRRIRPGWMIGSIGRAPLGARSFASDRGWRRLEERKGFYMGGYLRGCSIRAGRKEDERMSLNMRGGCNLSHRTAWKINKKKPSRMGGIVSILSREQNHFGCRPGGVLRSGKARIGTEGVAETGGTVGTPNFESVSRQFAAAGMLPQGCLAGERGAQHEPNRHVAVWVRSHLFLCYRIVLRIGRNYYGSSSIHKSHWFPHK